jgi:hypothetical protein
MKTLDNFPQISRVSGDPYGNRTRVSAVKGLFPLKSMARPAFHHSFLPLSFNGLAQRGDAE